LNVSAGKSRKRESFKKIAGMRAATKGPSDEKTGVQKVQKGKGIGAKHPQPAPHTQALYNMGGGAEGARQKTRKGRGGVPTKGGEM